MKNFINRLVVMFTFVASIFCVTACFGGGVEGKTYQVVKAELKSNTMSQEELDYINDLRLAGEVGETLVFAEDGTFGEESSLTSIYGLVRLNTWSQSGDTITINGGNNIYPTKAYVDGEQVVIEVGNINGMLFVYTFEEVK